LKRLRYVRFEPQRIANLLDLPELIMKQKQSQNGFSLIEMMLAMSLTIALTGVVFSLMRKGQQAFVVEGSRSELTQNFRAASDLISRDIQAAGAGIPGFLGPIAGIDGTGTNPDVLMVMYGNSTFTPVNVTVPPTALSSNITTDIPLTAFTSGDYFLYTVAQPQDASGNISDYAEFRAFSLNLTTTPVTNITNGRVLTPTAKDMNFSGQGTGYWDATVEAPSSSALRVAKVDEVIQYRLLQASRELQRNRNNSGWVTVARGISNFQLRYKTEKMNTGTGTFDPFVWQDQVLKSDVSNRALIRSVEVTITAQTQMAMDMDKQGQRFLSDTFEVTPRNLALPGFIPNR
jgi:prepilin-type N-terminal cleavage/methylation domain-containing protein